MVMCCGSPEPDDVAQPECAGEVEIMGKGMRQHDVVYRHRHLDPSSQQRVLMKTGLILLIIGHLNFITSALVHGTVLRFVVSPRDATSLQYAVTNAASVISALLTISCGIAALMLSRYLGPAALKWVVFALSTGSSLGCLSSLLGVAASIGLTLHSQGRALLSPCTVADVTLAPISRDCPFDPTRVYSSTLSLWTISLLLDLMEIIFGIRCLLLALDLLRLGRCCRGVRQRKVSLQAAPEQIPDHGQCLGLLRLDSVETA
nr:transmembrane protein 54 [Columba livia]